MKLSKLILVSLMVTMMMTTTILAVEVTNSKDKDSKSSLSNHNGTGSEVTSVTPQKKKRQDVDEKAAPPNAAVLQAVIQNQQNAELNAQVQDLVQSPTLGPGYPLPSGPGPAGLGIGFGPGPGIGSQLNAIEINAANQELSSYGSPQIQPGVITTSGGFGGISGGYSYPRPNPNINLFPAIQPLPINPSIGQPQIQPVPIPRYTPLPVPVQTGSYAAPPPPIPFIAPRPQYQAPVTGGYSNGPVITSVQQPIPFYRRPQTVGFGSIISTNYPQFVENTFRQGGGFNYRNYYNYRPPVPFNSGFQGGSGGYNIQPSFSSIGVGFGGIQGGNGIVTGGYA